MTETADQTQPENTYRLIGSEESPYSVKVRSYLRYKSIPHQWLTRSEADELYQQLAKLPLIPLLITPEGGGFQDSTPIMEMLEQRHQEPSIHPEDTVCRFISFLLEEFGDEWGNKWMFHYRWAREADQLACSRRLAELITPGATDRELSDAAATISERMVNRVWFVGSSIQTAQQIEDSFKDTLALLDPHLAGRRYLFGARPAFADFALWGQLYNASRDPTPREILRTQAPNVVAWIERMSDPQKEGPFERWSTLHRTLRPLLIDQVAGLFLPWSRANEAAVARQDEQFSVTLRSGQWTQKTQKYHARSLAKLRTRYAAYSYRNLETVLADTGCLEHLI